MTVERTLATSAMVGPAPPASGEFVTGVASMPRVGVDASSLLISFYLCSLVLIGLLLVDHQLVHWFVLPVFCSGGLIGYDAVRWARGRIGLLDPYGLLGLIGLHFFFLAPLLHVTFGYWMPYIDAPPDWRPWLGRMAILNLLGILGYFVARTVVTRRTCRKHQPWMSVWQLNTDQFNLLLAIFMAVSFVLQLYIYARFGGIAGYVNAYTTRTNEASFAGLGWLFMLSEAFPMLFMFGYVVFVRKTGMGKSWFVIAGVMLLFLVERVFFGGLRGSRANYVWPLFWGVGLIHLWIRPLSRKVMLIGLLFLVLFMYGYGFYKTNGSNAFASLSASSSSYDTSSTTNRGLVATLLGDLARSDVQSFVLYRLTDHASGSDYQYSWGRTYIGSVSLLIPHSLWPGRPPSKVKEGTQALYGMASWTSGHFRSTFAFGLGGETMLNFGPLAVPLAYGIFGGIVALLRNWCRRVPRDDSRTLLVPFVISLCLFFLLWDSDVILYYIFTSGLLPFLIVVFASTKTRVLSSSLPPLRGTAKEGAGSWRS